MAADDAHHQAAARAGVAEVERLARWKDRAEAWPSNSPCARRETLGDGAQRLASLAGCEHIVALKQSLDFRLAAGE